MPSSKACEKNFTSYSHSNPKKISTFSREENERRIVNGSNYPNTSHDITDSDILLESRIEKMNVRDSFDSLSLTR